MTKEQLIKIIKEIPETNLLYLQGQKALQLLDGDNIVIESNLGLQPVEYSREIMERRLVNSKRNNTPILGLPELVLNLQSAAGNVGGGYAKSGDNLLYFYLNDQDELLGLIRGPSED